MPKVIVTVVVVVVASLAAVSTAGGDRAATRVRVPDRLSGHAADRVRIYGPHPVSIHLPAGWRRLHGWLSDVVDPAPVVAVASFPARLSRHTCSCGFPNVVDFPRDGAFIFVWEYVRSFSHQALAGVPRRPERFHLAGARAVLDTCAGLSDTLLFRDAGRVFQVEVYLGPAAGPALRAKMIVALDSLRA